MIDEKKIIFKTSKQMLLNNNYTYLDGYYIPPNYKIAHTSNGMC